MRARTIAQLLPGLALVALTVQGQTAPQLPLRQVLRPSAEDIIGNRQPNFGEIIDADGDTLAVGMGVGAGAGAVAIFTRDSTGTWTRTATVMPDDSTEFDQFGVGVAVDNDTLVVTTGRQAVYVFQRNNGSWLQLQKLSFPDKFIPGGFDGRLDLAHDVAAIAAGDAATNIAEALILRRQHNGLFALQAVLHPSGGGDANTFPGLALRFNKSGNVLAVGVSGEAARQGAAYIFRRQGAVWTEQQRLTAADGQPGDEFGQSVALDGRILVVGAPSAVRPDIVGNGTGYVFVRHGSSWQQQYELQPSAEEWPTDVGALGTQVEITPDSIVASAPFGTLRSLFVYERDRQSEVLKALALDTSLQGVGLASTGTTLFSGNPDDASASHINVYGTSAVSAP